MNTISLIISIISLIVSIIVVVICFLQYKQVTNINIINLESEYYKEVFMVYLLKKIPNARKYIKFNLQNGLDEGYKELTDVITSIRQDILYFYYRNNRFYKCLDELLVYIDEQIVIMAGEEDIQLNIQGEFQDILDKKINEIYELIFDNYLGRSK